MHPVSCGIVGFGDTLSFGGTKAIRDFSEIGDVNTSNNAYLVGQGVGMVYGAALGGGVAESIDFARKAVTAQRYLAQEFALIEREFVDAFTRNQRRIGAIAEALGMKGYSPKVISELLRRIQGGGPGLGF